MSARTNSVATGRLRSIGTACQLIGTTAAFLLSWGRITGVTSDVVPAFTAAIGLASAGFAARVGSGLRTPASRHLSRAQMTWIVYGTAWVVAGVAAVVGGLENGHLTPTEMFAPTTGMLSTIAIGEMRSL